MKYKLVSLVSAAALGLFVVFLFLDMEVMSSSDLNITVQLPKESYVLGEVVKVDIEIKNVGDSDVYLRGTDVSSEYVEILISWDGKDFKTYKSASRGQTGKGRVLKVSESVKSNASILSNAVYPTSHLSETAAREFTQKQLMTVYAFPEIGDYFIKTVLIIPSETGNKKYQSEPIRVKIIGPLGEDLEIWNTMKGRADFAYFIQKGEPVRFSEREEQSRFLQEVENLVSRFPNSLYAESFRQSLRTFHENEAKRIEYLQKVQLQNERRP